jgi:hypothetical protein
MTKSFKQFMSESIATHTVRLEYGHQEGDSKEYVVKAKDKSDAVKKAISQHRKNYPEHDTHMLKNNAYVTKN